MKKMTLITLATATSFMFIACGKEATEASKTKEQLTEAVEEQVASEGPEDIVEEAKAETPETEEFGELSNEDSPTVDVTGCDTFTQIVDKNLADGQGYATESVGDADILFVSSGAFDDGEGNSLAIDSTLLMYKDGVPTEIGFVCSGSTACPISLKDKNIFTGSNHWVSKSTVKDGEVVVVERAWVEYDTSGNETYYYESGEGYGTKQTDSTEFDRLFAEYEEAEPINFSVVAK